MANYSYLLNIKSEYERFKKDLSSLSEIVRSEKFLEYLANKCIDELRDICSYSLIGLSEHSAFDAKIEEYKRSHKKYIGKGFIVIYNGTTLAQDEMFWVSEKTRENYPDGFSIAYALEYGIGVPATPQDDWPTFVNSNGLGHAGDNSWYYYNPDSMGEDGNFNALNRSFGYEGRFIYQKLMDAVQDKITIWLSEYLERVDTPWQ